MKNLFFLLTFLFFSFIISSKPALAATIPYTITPGFHVADPNSIGGFVFFMNMTPLDYNGGRIVLSSNPDGTGEINAGHGVKLKIQTLTSFSETKVQEYTLYNQNCSSYSTLPSQDVTSMFKTGRNHFAVYINSYCFTGGKDVGSIYLVHLDAPDPAPPPAPTPFLDLPWDYQAKGLSFTEAALAMSSFFDHEYPLLSSGLPESESAKQSIIRFDKVNRTQDSYSSHDGYDYAKVAKVNIGDQVLAAASGYATYINNCSACGNMILIDHQNGYQSRYLHLQKDGLITNVPGQRVFVNARQPIGKVGATGNVIPSGDAGAHIHFGLIQDKNNDGNFEDNIPDGITDPFGWKSTQADPWAQYSFFFNGEQRTGNKSFYLWQKPLNSKTTTIPSQGNIVDMDRISIQFPPGIFSQPFNFSVLASPLFSSPSLMSLGATFSLEANNNGNPITQFLNLFNIVLDFSTIDLSFIKPDTISVYSSSDGNNWTKENTSVDMLNKKATTQVNHLSYFAVMGEKADIQAPSTNINIDGAQGQDNWFKSDVNVTFQAQDSNSGIDYTMYKVDDQDWEQYTQPLIFTNENHYTIQYYSVDTSDNKEEIKTVEFDIDKTAPEFSIEFNPQTEDFIISGKDGENDVQVRQIDLKKNKLQFVVTDTASNLLTIDAHEKVKGKNARIFLDSLQYNDSTVTLLNKNKLFVEYDIDSTGNIKELRQVFQIKDEIKLKLFFNPKTNKTKVVTKENGQEKQKALLEGLKILKLFTQNSTLEYAY